MRSRVMCLIFLVCVCMCKCMCIYVYMYMWTKVRAVWGLTTRKSPVSIIYSLLVGLNDQKGVYYARRFVQERNLELFY